MGATHLWIVAFGTLVLPATFVPASAQPGTVLAVTDLVDDGADGSLIHASRLSTYLEQKLQALAGDHLQVVAGEQVRAAMRAQGIAPQGFLTRSAATALAAAVGASQIVTGRWSTLALAPQPDEPAGVSPRGNEHRATAILEIWVMDGTSGAVLLQAAYTGRAWGAGGRIVLLDAAREALNRAANAIAQL